MWQTGGNKVVFVLTPSLQELIYEKSIRLRSGDRGGQSTILVLYQYANH